MDIQSPGITDCYDFKALSFNLAANSIQSTLLNFRFGEIVVEFSRGVIAPFVIQ